MSRTTPFGRSGGKPAPARRRGMVLEALAATLALCALAYVLVEREIVTLPRAGAVPDTVAHAFVPCAGEGGTCVVDGDTIRIAGVPIRIADIDTPETRDYRCPEELALGQAATRRMLELVNAGPFALEMWDHRDTDIYGRKLRVLSRDGQSLGLVLVAEGLARPWDGTRRGWCG